MRNLAALVATSCFAGCTSTFAEPRILVSPYLALYRLRGDSSLQSRPAPQAPPEDNGAQSLRLFGQNHFREDVGVRTDIGDGFGGLRVDYYRLDQGTSRNGVLEDDWGALQVGDPARMRVAMDELRVAYLEPVWSTKANYRERPLQLRAAVGAMLTWRDLALGARTVDGSRGQGLGIEGETASVAARLRATWRDISLELDYALSPDAVLGGDFGGMQQDVELRASYTLSLQDITFFGGYRYSELLATGSEGGLRYDADFVLDGFQLGVAVTF